MQFAFLCHAPEDTEVARNLGEWLERNTPCEIRLSPCGAGCVHDLVEAAEQGLSGTAVIVLLSPASVPERWIRSRWERVLLEAPLADGVGMAFVLLRDCKFPDLLRRRHFFEFSLAGRRDLKRWLLNRFRSVASLPSDRVDAVAEDAIERLRVEVADEPGSAQGVERDLALSFARQCTGDFEGVFWVDCTRRTLAGICGDLAHLLGLTLTGPAPENRDRVREFCAGRRVLIVFESCAEAPFQPEGRCSVLQIPPGPPRPPVAPEELSRMFGRWMSDPDPCLSALGDVAGAIGSRDWEAVRGVAFSAVALLRHRERAAELLELVEDLIPRAAAAGDSPGVRHFEWERGWILQAWGRTEPVAAPMLPPGPGDQLALPFSLG